MQPVIRQIPMSADDGSEQRATVAEAAARPMPNPHYDRLPAGYQPFELLSREETERLLDRD